ncbi:MAG: ANTAR domain-containing response regulator [Bacillota bacterium]
MSKALIVSGSSKGMDNLCSLLKLCGLSQTCIMQSATEARRMLVDHAYDLIVINTPLPDEFGVNFAIHASTATNSAVVMLVKSEMAENISYKVENQGVIVLHKPIQKHMLFQAVKMGLATYKRLLGVKNQNQLLQKKLDDLKTVGRAKGILIQYLSMTEADAHRFIEKQAMDMRISKVAVAEGIIRTYES